MTYATTLRYGRFAPALEKAGVEDARDRDHKTREKARRNRILVSESRTQLLQESSKIPSFDSNLYSQFADLPVMTQNDEALATFKSALTGSSRDQLG